jgi:restriction endonuclease
MQLRFKAQRHQAEAVDAVVDCFAGQPRAAGVANAEIALGPERLLDNIRAVQRGRGLPESPALADSRAATTPNTPNLYVEMETGTGKTYVYIKTIMELNRRYGWSKFIVVVPSVAIREGVRKSFEVTAEHFKQAYGGRPRAFGYSSARLHELDRFASDAGVQVMIINIQAFNAAGKDDRRIYDVLDAFQSRRPIDVIGASRPIVIIDEPQRIGSAKSLAALARLRPLMVLRYSATHRIEHNRVYRLDAVDAYQRKLVKKIAVRGITVQGLPGSTAYLYLDAVEVTEAARPTARVELEVRTAAGVRRRVRRLGLGARLHEVSGGIEAYRGLAIADIDAGRGAIELNDGTVVSAGQVTADVTDEAKRRIQIREVIRAHLAKERELFPRGIKVLSLFFIDEVAKYRDYGRADTRGAYARAFAAEYTEQVTELLGRLAGDEAAYRDYLAAIPVDTTHQGYFSIDKKTGRYIDGDVKRSGDEKGQSTDAAAYDLILRDKERLLSLGEKVRFIFSHSALREGWDNPNVFVLGMLKKSDSSVSRRQEIGRGLRLSVDQNGERTDDPATVHLINELTVVTDESYTAFVDGLQRELSAAPGTQPGRPAAYPRPADGRTPKPAGQQEQSVGGLARARHVEFDSGELIDRCVTALDDRLKVATLRYVVQQGAQRPADAAARAGFTTVQSTTHAAPAAARSPVAYDLIGDIARQTRLTRRTVAAILRQIGQNTFAQYRQNPAEFIAESARLINAETALTGRATELRLAQQVLVPRPELLRRPDVGALRHRVLFRAPHAQRSRRHRRELGPARPVKQHRGHDRRGQVGADRDDAVLREQDRDRVAERRRQGLAQRLVLDQPAGQREARDVGIAEQRARVVERAQRHIERGELAGRRGVRVHDRADVRAGGHDLRVDRVFDVPRAAAREHLAAGRDEHDPAGVDLLEAPARGLHPDAAAFGVADARVSPHHVRLAGGGQCPAAVDRKRERPR